MSLVCGMQTLNLTVDCLDRPGLLAEIAQIIASYGHNIKVCSWQTLPSTLLAGDEASAAYCGRCHSEQSSQ